MPSALWWRALPHADPPPRPSGPHRRRTRPVPVRHRQRRARAARRRAHRQLPLPPLRCVRLANVSTAASNVVMCWRSTTVQKRPPRHYPHWSYRPSRPQFPDSFRIRSKSPASPPRLIRAADAFGSPDLRRRPLVASSARGQGISLANHLATGLRRNLSHWNWFRLLRRHK